MDTPKWEDTQTLDEPKWDDTRPIDDEQEKPLLEQAKGAFEDYVVDQLQPIGATAGGLVGGTLGTLPGGIAGAAAGGAAGKSLENLYNQNFRPEKAPQEVSEYITQPLKAAAESAGDEVLGMGLGRATEMILPALVKAGRISKEMAEEWAARALGAERGTIKKLGPEKVREAGRYALENIITPFATTENKVARNLAAQRSAGETMGDIYNKIDAANASNFNPSKVAANVSSELGGFWRDPINKPVTNQFDNILESIQMRGKKNIPLSQAQTLKETIGNAANWKNNLVISDKERMARDAYGIVNKAIDEAVEQGAGKIGEDGLQDALKAAKQKYGNSKAAEELLYNKTAREEGNKFFGLTDTIAASAGAFAGPVGTLGTLGTKRVAERFGPNVVAIGLDKIGDILKASPQTFGRFTPFLQSAAQRGPTALGATHFILQQNSREYQQHVQSLQENQD